MLTRVCSTNLRARTGFSVALTLVLAKYAKSTRKNACISKLRRGSRSSVTTQMRGGQELASTPEVLRDCAILVACVISKGSEAPSVPLSMPLSCRDSHQYTRTRRRLLPTAECLCDVCESTQTQSHAHTHIHCTCTRDCTHTHMQEAHERTHTHTHFW